ncbi:MAG TPA: GGDEF domain-containing protein [Thermoanaerobaculia bacterium]|jgi:diguanylate cyclase (GGDEF)-like protein|nr:GGDEF domain-containing protein [Thermoanaerobaculia bacterium]
MTVENEPSARHLPLPAVGIAVALSLGVIALWRFAPRLLPALALLLAWGVALFWGMALAARHQGRESEEARRRLEDSLASSAHDTDSLRQEVEGYRGFFESRPAERKVPAVPAPANVHSFIRDPLTGLFHRRYFEASVEREIHRMERRNLPLGIILMRLDASEFSDELLRAVGALLNRRVRGGDVASYHEGGIFGLILPEAPLAGVRTRAEQIRSAVREMELTLSFGVAAFPDCGHSSEKLLRAVRAALDEARAGGGDCVAMAPGAVLDRRLMLPD